MDLEHLTTGIVEGSNSRGHYRRNYLDSLLDTIHNMMKTKIIRLADDREDFQSMVVNVDPKKKS